MAGEVTHATRAVEADRRLVAALRAGDEAAFMALVDELGPSMLRLAMQFTPSRAVAEEVVQETWLAVLNGLDRFEGRSSLKTWILRILVNRAKTRGTRERRTVPFAALAAAEADGDFTAVEPERFNPADRRARPTTGRRRCRAGRRSRARRGVARDARGGARGDRRTARDAAHRDPAARRRGLGRTAGQ